MARQKGVSIAVMYFGNDEYSIRVTAHAWQQMCNRGISVNQVVETIHALGQDSLLKTQADETDVCVSNKEEGISVVFGWDNNKIMVVTVLSEADNVFVKKKTLCYSV